MVAKLKENPGKYKQELNLIAIEENRVRKVTGESNRCITGIEIFVTLINFWRVDIEVTANFFFEIPSFHH